MAEVRLAISRSFLLIAGMRRSASPPLVGEASPLEKPMVLNFIAVSEGGITFNDVGEKNRSLDEILDSLGF